MVKNVKEQIEVLVKLQGIESEQLKIKTDLNEISKKNAVLDEALNAFGEKIATDELSIKALQKMYRSYESEIEENQARQKKSQEKLGSVKNNKEYQSILKEIDDFKAKNSQIEDMMIDCLGSIDEAENKLSSMQHEYSQLAQDTKNEKEEISKQIEQGKQTLDGHQREWEVVSQGVEPELMAQYVELKTQIKGGVIAPVMDSVCDGCHMNIPPQTYNELQRFDSLKYCPFCHRIIYWKK